MCYCGASFIPKGSSWVEVTLPEVRDSENYTVVVTGLWDGTTPPSQRPCEVTPVDSEGRFRVAGPSGAFNYLAVSTPAIVLER